MESEEASTKAAVEAALPPRPGPPPPPPPPPPPRGVNRGLSVGDLILRILAGAGTLGSGVAMATTNQTLPFFSQLVRYQAQFSDLPAFTFFVVANGVVCGYLLLSLPLSVFHIIRSKTVGTRLLLLILDTVAVVLLTAGGAAAAAIVYLAHKGNTSANWGAICQQYNSFCGRISASLIGSFLGVIVMILLIIFSALVLSKCSRSI